MRYSVARSRRSTLWLIALPTLVIGSRSASSNRTRYNSDEHRLLVDRGVAGVVIPPTVHFPRGIEMRTETAAQYLAAFRRAKHLAVGFENNDPKAYSDKTPSVQDNCYWTGYHQLDYNKAITIPDAADAPSSVLVVQGFTAGSASGGFSLGQLAALYGDYRRTTYCDATGRCFLTDAELGQIGFARGNVGDRRTYCPAALNAGQYLQDIGAGLVPPFGSAGNVVRNTANDDEYGDAGWWGDEMMRIANVNDWHFASGAIAWYVGLHRLALLYADSARMDPKYWARALHDEANALHALTDLFAFGHVVTNRDETAYGIMTSDKLLEQPAYRWMENVIRMGGGKRSESSAISLSSNLPRIADVPGIRKDFMKSYAGSWALRADGERRYHDEFNTSGAFVRNLNGDAFLILGDKGLSKMLMNTAGDSAIVYAVQRSVQSLLDAHDMLQKGAQRDSIGRAGSSYYAALKFVPVYITRDGNGYFPGQWTRYAQAVNEISGANKPLPDWPRCRVAYLSGSDGPSWPSKPAKPCAPF